MNSPPQKRSKQQQITFEEFDTLPIYTRDKVKWNNLLKDNMDFWKLKHEEWAKGLKCEFNFFHKTTHI